MSYEYSGRYYLKYVKLPEGYTQDVVESELWRSPKRGVTIDHTIIAGRYMEMYIAGEGWRRYDLKQYNEIRVFLEAL